MAPFDKDLGSLDHTQLREVILRLCVTDDGTTAKAVAIVDDILKRIKPPTEHNNSYNREPDADIVSNFKRDPDADTLSVNPSTTYCSVCGKHFDPDTEDDAGCRVHIGIIDDFSLGSNARWTCCGGLEHDDGCVTVSHK